AVDVAAEAQRSGDRPLHGFPRDATAPVRLAGQEAVDQFHVQLVPVGADAQAAHAYRLLGKTAVDGAAAGRSALPAGCTSTRVVAPASMVGPQRLTSAHRVLLMPNSLMKPSASSTPQSADWA